MQNILKKAFPQKAKSFMNWKQNSMLSPPPPVMPWRNKKKQQQEIPHYVFLEVVKLADLQGHNVARGIVSL